MRDDVIIADQRQLYAGCHEAAQDQAQLGFVGAGAGIDDGAGIQSIGLFTAER